MFELSLPADVKEGYRPTPLGELRACLFVCQRAHRYGGWGFDEFFRALLEKLAASTVGKG